jgi:hypothetical protein
MLGSQSEVRRQRAPKDSNLRPSDSKSDPKARARQENRASGEGTDS